MWKKVLVGFEEDIVFFIMSEANMQGDVSLNFSLDISENTLPIYFLNLKIHARWYFLFNSTLSTLFKNTCNAK